MWSRLQSPPLSMKLLHSSFLASWGFDHVTNLIYRTSLPNKTFLQGNPAFSELTNDGDAVQTQGTSRSTLASPLDKQKWFINSSSRAFQGKLEGFLMSNLCILLTLHQGTAVWDMRSAAHKMTSLYFFLYLPLCLRKSTTDLLSRKQAEAPLGKRLKKRYQLQPSSSQVSAEAVHSINWD